MKKLLPNKEVVNPCLAFCCFAVVPLSIWMTRPRPLTAISSGELARLACEARQEEIITQMSKRYAAMIGAESAGEAEKPDLYWQKLQASMSAAGAGEDEAAIVTRLAQNSLSQEWPVLVERGVLKGNWVWIVVGSTPGYAGLTENSICPPSRADFRKKKKDTYGATARAVIISAQAPYSILN